MSESRLSTVIAKRRRAVSTVAAVALCGALLAACGSGSSSGAGGKSENTIIFAEAASANPNYIFPYMSCDFFSVSNINQFQQLMYRPVYWFGLGSSAAIQPQLSFAKLPTFSNSNKTLSFTMKGWKFSNGETVDAQSAMFFLNLYKADPSAYCGYNQGYGIPDQVSSVSSSGSTVTMNFKQAVNPNWILYNYLSELTALPQAWDKSSASAAAGSGGCASGTWGASSTITACKAVLTFLQAQAKTTSSYAGSFWQVVDGPWKLTAFDSLGNATFVPNDNYSGPQKAQVDKVKLNAYTTTQAEENDLYAGKLSLGYVDPQQLPGPAASPGEVGPNISRLKGKYTLMTGSPWAFNYAPFNFSSTNPKSALINQLYIRQALQHAVDQVGIIRSVQKGYGYPTCSPIPPKTPLSIAAPVVCKYRYSLNVAKGLLTDHGWAVQNGVQTCTRPGTASNQCGAGIAQGDQLHLSILWANGSPAQDATMNAQVSAWKSIGIQMDHSEQSFNNIISQCNGGTFQICSWGGGWVYAPGYYPSGESLLTPTSGFNPGSYSDAHMTELINQTTFGDASLTEYGKYAAEQLPVLYQPNATSTTEVTVNLKGVLPLNPLQNFMPEYMYF